MIINLYLLTIKAYTDDPNIPCIYGWINYIQRVIKEILSLILTLWCYNEQTYMQMRPFYMSLIKNFVMKSNYGNVTNIYIKKEMWIYSIFYKLKVFHYLSVCHINTNGYCQRV